MAHSWTSVIRDPPVWAWRMEEMCKITGSRPAERMRWRNILTLQRWDQLFSSISSSYFQAWTRTKCAKAASMTYTSVCGTTFKNKDIHSWKRQRRNLTGKKVLQVLNAWMQVKLTMTKTNNWSELKHKCDIGSFSNDSVMSWWLQNFRLQLNKVIHVNCFSLSLTIIQSLSSASLKKRHGGWGLLNINSCHCWTCHYITKQTLKDDIYCR